MKQEMRELLEQTFKGDKIIKYIERLEDTIHVMLDIDCNDIIDDSCIIYDNCEDCKKDYFKRLQDDL